jgi:hypothetical protein
VALTPSGLGDLFRDFDEIFSDYITLKYLDRLDDAKRTRQGADPLLRWRSWQRRESPRPARA